MKNKNFKIIRFIAFITVFWSLLVTPALSQTANLEIENPKATENTQQTPDTKLESAKIIEHKINCENVKIADSKRKSFLAAGHFWGFAIWILLLLNTILFLSAAIASWNFIRKHRAYPRELVHRVKTVLNKGDLGFVMEACTPCNTPLSRILFSAFKNVSEGFEVCKEEMRFALKAEYERMLKTTRLLLNCSVYSFVLGLLGCGVSLLYALRSFSENDRLSNWQELAYSTAQSLYPLMAGLVIAYLAFWFYQYCIGKINRIKINTEKIAYDLIKYLREVHMDEDLLELATMTRLIDPKTIVSLSKDKLLSQKHNSQN
jgi:biopolymer transport protein ExbB/TolQ